jgi:hypothetical protein
MTNDEKMYKLVADLNMEYDKTCTCYTNHVAGNLIIFLKTSNLIILSRKTSIIHLAILFKAW